MHIYVTHPAIQAFLAPFLIALLSAELFQRMRLSGLAIIAGFAITVYLASNFAYTPLNGTRKIIWLGLASGLLAIPLSLANWSLWRPLLTVLGACAGIWVLQNQLVSHPFAMTLQWGAGIMLYVGALVFLMDDLQDSPVRAASAGTVLGLGSGATLLIAGSTLLGKFDLAVGSAAFALLFIMFVSNSAMHCGRTFTLPLALITGLSSSLAVLTTKLPWYTLAVLAAIPLVAKLPASDKSPVWIQGTLLTAAALCCGAGAMYISWRIYGWSAF
ncbi:MAG: hypothetical protein ACOH1I_09530 [Gallionellaceae bacterium]